MILSADEYRLLFVVSVHLFVFFDPRRFLAFEKGLHSGLTFFASTRSRDGIGGEFQRAFQGTRCDAKNQFFRGGDRVGCRGEDLRNFRVDESIEREVDLGTLEQRL